MFRLVNRARTRTTTRARTRTRPDVTPISLGIGAWRPIHPYVTPTSPRYDPYVTPTSPSSSEVGASKGQWEQGREGRPLTKSGTGQGVASGGHNHNPYCIGLVRARVWPLGGSRTQDPCTGMGLEWRPLFVVPRRYRGAASTLGVHVRRLGERGGDESMHL